ncbi:diguanylate cyclase [Paraburkholderia sp. SIMBA_055]|jgi:diguanylate cyclase (GGDEF)-like protein|uniref:Diguanylate cyclase n=1 Tax=Paraburkholderia graminis (strain ATCC 700544 / DSM 17151 / LMG 18924 / NCIMB 13744 / C4D1M) TaxID=396598 RepID=B1G006_PARG4|nr:MULTISPECIES: diguanylate cyclase [Paraburkholderia]EDT10544.1 diguanylate cyclase [Paraburkholderia graminis C4D1M]MDR6470593.1 diguanylate cyclase (GGDEF)-like protein [Paraburkholderia graminis]MDR6475344.1 diguanylate cyclase (GGDEF)-like protein [Paraburkholderia graminis]PTQ97305.1 diguanylate cyclase (GGDEF)-like protein [Paraburkholderia sp. GV072]PUB02844.1 diguanylate cyclase (GGDEF)-like protein [Paraburkholderia sp. GV068]
MIRPGLTFKLSVLLACIGVLASGATGYYAYHSNRTMLVKEAGRSLLTSTELLGERFSASIDDVGADALVLASLPSSAEVVAADDGLSSSLPRERLAQVYSSFMIHHAEYLQIRLISRANHGLEIIRFDRDADGLIRVQGGSLQEKGQFPYVFEPLAFSPGRLYTSPISVNHEYGAHAAQGKPTLRVGTPVANAQGAVVGVVVIDVNLSNLLKRLQSDLPSDYQVYLANEWGDFLVHPDAAKTFGFDVGRRVLMQDSFAVTKPLFEQKESEVLANGLARPHEADGQVLAFVRRPFGASEGNRFIVLGLGKPLEDVLSGAHLLGGSIIRMVLVFSALAVLLAILFARALTKPLHILAYAATHLFAEHAMGTLPLKRTDEIGVLARCFDRLRREIRSQMDALHVKQRELVHLATHDVLTGLPNRMLFMEKLERAIQDATRRREGLAVLFVDLDRFKQINDQFGHAVGDKVLVAVALRLKQVLHSADVVARLGGDEFIVLIEGPRSAEAAPGIASRIMTTLNEEIVMDGQGMTVGASIGISQFPDDSGTAEELLLNADAAMYAAKSGGRCAYLRYHDVLEARRRQQTEPIEVVQATAGDGPPEGREAEPTA